MKDDKKKESKEVPAQDEQPSVVSASFYPGDRGSVVPQRSGSSAQSVGTDAGSEQTHGYGVSSAVGATSTQAPIEQEHVNRNEDNDDESHVHSEQSIDSGNQWVYLEHNGCPIQVEPDRVKFSDCYIMSADVYDPFIGTWRLRRGVRETSESWTSWSNR